MQQWYRNKLKRRVQVESLDFEQVDGSYLRQHYRQQKRSRRLVVQSDLFKYGVSFMIALIVAVLYFIVKLIVDRVANYRIGILKQAQLGQTSAVQVWLTCVGLSLAFALPACGLIALVPSAEGSGVSEVIAYLNGIDMLHVMNFKVLVAKYLSMICMVASGLFTGYDGPMVLIGTITAILLIRQISQSKWLNGYFYGDAKVPMQNTIYISKYRTSSLRPVDQGGLEDQDNVLQVAEKQFLRIFAASGAACGLTAVFKAPLGGVMFALEEAVSFYEPAILIRAFFATIATYFMVSLFTYAAQYGSLYVSYSLYDISAYCQLFKVSVSDIVAYFIFGIMCGILGHGYNVLLNKTRLFKERFLISRLWIRVVEVGLLCLVTMSVITLLPLIRGLDSCTAYSQAISHIQLNQKDCIINCRNSDGFIQNEKCNEEVCLPFKAQRQFGLVTARTKAQVDQICFSNGTDIGSVQRPAYTLGEVAAVVDLPISMIQEESRQCYYQLSSLYFSTPDNIIKNLFSRGTYYLFDARELLIFIVTYLAISMITHNSMLPTDVLVPNLVIGAAFGRLAGTVINLCYIRLGFDALDPGFFALLGFVGIWCGTGRLILTACIIAVESTSDVHGLPGIVLVGFMATVIGNWLGKSQYHSEIKRLKLPVLPHGPELNLKTLRVCDLTKHQPLVVFNAEEKRSVLLEKLSGCSHNGFPVVQEHKKDDEGSLNPEMFSSAARQRVKYLIGFVLRSQIESKLSALNINMHKFKHSDSSLSHDRQQQGTARSSQEQISLNTLQVQDPYIHLMPIMNNSPYVVHPETSLSKAFLLFRHLGLRHLCVVDYNGVTTGHPGKLLGILTRSDLVDVHDETRAFTMDVP